MDLEYAQHIAQNIKGRLGPACDRIAIAGSIRRGKSHPKDIELVYIPKIEHRVINLFNETEPHSLVDDLLPRLLTARDLQKDEQVKRWGPKHKRLIYVPAGAVVELFAANEDNWGLILALRTGPAAFNQKLVSSVTVGGAMPFNMRMQNGYLWDLRQQLATPTEEAFFNALNLPTWPPDQRTADRLQHHLTAAHTQYQGVQGELVGGLTLPPQER